MIKYISLLIWFKWRFIDFINIIKIFGFANINIYQMDIWNLEKLKNIGKANFPWKKKYCGLHEEDIYLDVFFVKELNLVFRSHKKDNYNGHNWWNGKFQDDDEDQKFLT